MKPLHLLFPLLALAGDIAAQQMNYQGRLTDDTGAPLPGPGAALGFSLWDAATGGSRVWGDFELNADLIDGRFSVKLGEASGDDGSGRFLAEAFGGPRFLQIRVGADPPLPRQEVLPAPVALHAVNAEEVLADGGKLKIQSEPSLPGGPTNFQPGGGQAGWLVEYADPGGGDHGGLFLNGDTAALYNSGVGGLLNLYDEDELSDPSPAAPKFTVDANGGVVSGGGASFQGDADFEGDGGFGGDVVVAGGGSFNGLSSAGPVQVSANMSVTGGGRVGIGTTTPRAPLDVTSIGTVALPNFRFYAISGAANASAQTVSNVSIYTSGRVIAAEFDAVSDARIKNVAGLSDSSADLQTLLGLQITDYSLKDTVSNGATSQKKVIAQQVEHVFPRAVKKTTGVVPDIYRTAEVRDGWVRIETDLKQGDRVRLIGDGSEGIHEVKEVAEGRFRTDFAAGDHVFVYGREVDDLRTVDYDAIAMLNVSATQEIKREKDAEMRALREENAALRERLATMDAKDEERDARLSALERRLESQESKRFSTVSSDARSAAR